MQCEIAHIIYPTWAKQWINIKHTFTEFYSIESGRKLMKLSISFFEIIQIFFSNKGIHDMLDRLGLSFAGNLHSGLDDATNIATIVIALIKVNNYSE
jgi:3'-5' exoribonuclease 1